MSKLAENPRCNPVCKACHYKDLDYPAQLQKKNDWAREQLGEWNAVLEDISPAPEGERLHYRSKSWTRGFYQEGSLSFGSLKKVRKENGRWEKSFISWDTCPLHHPSLERILWNLKQKLPAANLPFVERSLVGIWFGSPHVVIISSDPHDLHNNFLREIDWEGILSPPFSCVWFHHNPQVGRNLFGHRPLIPLAGPQEDLDQPLVAFRQVAQTLLEEARKRAVQALLGEPLPEVILDLYCGTGELSSLLPPQMGWIGIELSQEAVRFAQGGSRSGGRSGIHRAFVGDVANRLLDPKVLDLIPASYAVFLNPPRSGLCRESLKSFLKLIREKAPTKVAYLSCSASGLSRDLKVLQEEGYQVCLLRPFDFFPQTEHFETLAILNPPISRAAIPAEPTSGSTRG